MSQNNTERGHNPMTAPPDGALEACLALLEKATDAPLRMEKFKEDDSLLTFGNTSVVDGDFRYSLWCGIKELDAHALAATWNLLRAHGSALLAALRLREWRPIESAPKDGTRVLLWIKWSDEPVVGEFSHGRWWAGTEHHEVSCGAYCYGGSVTSDKSMEPILWRPIEPPTADDLARVLEEGE